MDWSATAAWIALIVAIAAPVFTARLNNYFQLKMKELDFKFSKQTEYYQYQKVCFEKFIKFASKQIESDYKSERVEFCECFHEMLIYLPCNSWDEAKPLYDSIVNRKADAREKLYSFTQILASQLKESWQQFQV